MTDRAVFFLLIELHDKFIGETNEFNAPSACAEKVRLPGAGELDRVAKQVVDLGLYLLNLPGQLKEM
jgi:hypothetical protein